MPRLGFKSLRPGQPRPDIWAFAVEAAAAVYGFVVEIDPVKLQRSGLGGRELAGQARGHAIKIMLGRGHGPQDVRAGPPRRLDWDAAPDLSYCQFFGFAPNGGSILFLNRPPPGEKDQVAELALAAETSDEDPA